MVVQVEDKNQNILQFRNQSVKVEIDGKIYTISRGANHQELIVTSEKGIHQNKNKDFISIQ